MRFFALLVFVTLLLYPLLAITRINGPPAGRTGAPFESTCHVSCHRTEDLNGGAGLFQIEVPDTYGPGDTVDVKVKFSDTDRERHGFQITVQDTNARFIGRLSLVDVSVTRFASGSSRHINHIRAGAEESEWALRWTAPATPAGAVTFYASGVAADADDSTRGDFVYTTSRTMTPATSVDTEPALMHTTFALEPNHPNPFATQTTIPYRLSKTTAVRVSIYDVAGRIVEVLDEGVQHAGTHHTIFDATALPVGLYLVELRTPDAVQTRPLFVMR